MKDYMVLLKDCVDRVCQRLRVDCSEGAVQDLRRVLSEFDVFPAIWGWT